MKKQEKKNMPLISNGGLSQMLKKEQGKATKLLLEEASKEALKRGETIQKLEASMGDMRVKLEKIVRRYI